MAIRYALSFCLALLSLPAVAEPLGFKQFTLGAPRESFDTLTMCRHNLPTADELCAAQGEQTIAGTPAGTVQLNFIDGKLASVVVTFDHDNFITVGAGLLEKFGKPTREQYVKKSNAFGAVVNSAEMEWERPDGTVRAQEHLGTLTRSAVFFYAASYRASVEKRVAAERKKVSTDF